MFISIWDDVMFYYYNLQHLMSEEPKSPKGFCIEKAFEKGPLHLLHSFRLGQLQNKINFFEGQVDPLLEENISLKDQMIALSKLVLSSTEILRNLLPTYDHPNKRLKLQMATIEEIANMIKEDWHRMENRLADNAKTIKQLREQRDHWKDCFEEEKIERARDVYGLQEENRQSKVNYEALVAGLKSSLAELQEKHEQKKRDMREEFEARVKGYLAGERQFQRFKRETRDREQEFQKRIARLNGEIDANLLSFEETKKNIKAIYDKLMADKIAQQAESFEMLLKMKEEQKMQVIIAMGEAEEEYKRRAAQKEYEITKLTERNDTYRQEVGQLKGDIWKKQLQLDKEFEQAKNRQQIITQLETQRKKLQQQLEENEEEYAVQKKNLERIIKSREEQLGLMKEEGSASLQKVIAQKAALEKELSQKQQKIRQALATIRKKDEYWQKQVQKLHEEWKIQEESIKNQLLQEQKVNKTWNDRLQESERQKAAIIKQNNEKMKRIEDIHKEHQYILQSKYQAQISELKETQQIEMNQMKMLHQRQLTEANINANESLRDVIANCNRRMTEQEANFLIEKANFEEQIKLREKQIEKAEKKLNEAVILMQKQKIEHQQAMRLANEAAEQEKQRLQNQMNKQMLAFQEEMEKHQAMLSEIKAEMEKQIKMLKEANAIESIENKFLNEINKLKEEFAERFKKAELQFKKSEEELASNHQNKVEQLKQGFNRDLVKIVEKIEQKSTFLNEKLLTGFNDSELIGMTEEQKKEYIIGKVEEIKKSNTQKQQKIGELEEALYEAERNVEKRVKARKEELQRQKEKFAKQCNQKLQAVTNECKAKVAEAEKDRIQHSQVMYIEFQALRDHHQGLVNALNKKYTQLETLFEERPSRMEDLTKIKELINMQTKLDIEIQSYQKKMETANEIVKYLNLELQNYKDAYDIFGPNGENITGGIVGVSAIKNNNNNPTSETQHILDVIKSHRHGSEARLMLNEERRQLNKEQLAFRKWNDTASPAVKELKLFQDDQSERSVVQSRDFSEPKQDKRYSYLIVDKASQRKNRFKTERSEKVEHENEILINAENFIKLIKGSQEDTPPPVVREMDQQRRKSYRKRKLHKRQPTQGFDHYF